MVLYLYQKQGRHNTKGEMKMTLRIQAITEMGCTVYTTINVREDYTMNEVVREVKKNRYKMFRLVDTMKRFVAI